MCQIKLPKDTFALAATLLKNVSGLSFSRLNDKVFNLVLKPSSSHYPIYICIHLCSHETGRILQCFLALSLCFWPPHPRSWIPSLLLFNFYLPFKVWLVAHFPKILWLRAIRKISLSRLLWVHCLTQYLVFQWSFFELFIVDTFSVSLTNLLMALIFLYAHQLTSINGVQLYAWAVSSSLPTSQLSSCFTGLYLYQPNPSAFFFHLMKLQAFLKPSLNPPWQTPSPQYPRQHVSSSAHRNKFSLSPT